MRRILPKAIALGLAACMPLSVLANTSAQLTEQVVKVADQIEVKVAFSPLAIEHAATQGVYKVAEFEYKDASYIKPHFARLVLPAGAYIEVANPNGGEAYRYGSEYNTSFTHNKAKGDDGITRFSSMSITGEAAVVRLVMSDATEAWDDTRHAIEIDHLFQGYSLAQKLAFEASAPGTESTCGVNERRDAACWAESHPTEYAHTTPVAKLLRNGSSLCTAWRVGPDNRMFTNEHCFTASDASSIEVWFNYQRTGCGGSDMETPTKVTVAEVLKSDYTLDYTLYRVNNFDTVQSFGWLGLHVGTANNNERIYIAQHGSGNPKELAIESDQNAGGLCAVDEASANGRGTATDIGYYCDTIGGSSGSPVLEAETNNAIALHHFGGCTNQGVKISEIWPQVSGYFNDEVPQSNPGGGTPPPPPPDPNGFEETNLSGSRGDWDRYSLAVGAEANRLEITISGGSGDADLYTRFGSEPSTGSWDCRPYRWGNAESCTADNPSAGTWHIGLRAYSDYSGVTLRAYWYE